MIKFFAALLIFVTIDIALLSRGLASAQRVVTTGYIKADSKTRVFFIRHPGILETGIEIIFKSAQARSRACVLTVTQEPLSCPVQRISFIAMRRFGKPILADAQIEPSNSAWGRLKAKEEIFKPTLEGH